MDEGSCGGVGSAGGRLGGARGGLLLEDPVTGEVLGFYHRTCIAGAEKLARQRPGELDLTMVYMPGVAVRS